jgi:hypothetical protein
MEVQCVPSLKVAVPVTFSVFMLAIAPVILSLVVLFAMLVAVMIPSE